MTRAVWAALGAAVLGSGCDAVAVPRGGEVDLPDPPPAAVVASVPPSAACHFTTDQFSFSMTTYADAGPAGQAPGPAVQLLACGADTGTVSFPAVVTDADGTSLMLSSCAEGTGCGHAVQLIVAAQDLSLPRPVGAFVQVDASVHATGEGCAQSLMIRNLPALGGLPNPLTAAPIVWFAGAEGTLATAPDSPIGVHDVEGCGADAVEGFSDDALSFALTQPGSAEPVALTLPMGISYIVHLDPTGTDSLLVRNLRSYHAASAPPGDQREFAYWIKYVSPALP